MTESLDYLRICESCPSSDGWGPSVTTETTLDGVPYAPFSKGDKLGRMADWTSGGKDGERGGRLQYQRNYRGELRLFRAKKAHPSRDVSIEDQGAWTIEEKNWNSLRAHLLTYFFFS